MQKLINWTAKRAGGRITVNGVDQKTQRPVKIVGIDEIRSGSVDDGLRLPSVATRFDGTEYELV